MFVYHQRNLSWSTAQVSLHLCPPCSGEVALATLDALLCSALQRAGVAKHLVKVRTYAENLYYVHFHQTTVSTEQGLYPSHPPLGFHIFPPQTVVILLVYASKRSGSPVNQSVLWHRTG